MNPEPCPSCPTCNAAIPVHAPGGFCPACLLRDAVEPPNQGHSTPPLEEITKAFPQWEVLELIGMGGMGFVYKVRQPSLDRTVAMKILSPELGRDPAFAERFAREARTLGKLHHPNIVTVFEHGESGGLFYLLMEYVDGVNLRQAMRAGRFTPEQALTLVPGICDALQYAHEQGVWHRDIKPENILLDRDGKVKIADFGIARIVGDPQRDFTLTRTGNALGSVSYMAPEQHEKPHEVDHRADIYSLGVVIYEMLTGELPLGRFPAPSQRAAVNQRIDEIVFKTLEKERELRQQSATEVKTELRGAGALPGTLQAATAVSPKPALFPTILLHALLFALIAAFFFIVVPRFGELLREMGVPRSQRPMMFLFPETLSVVLMFPVLFGFDVGLCALVRRMGGRRGLRLWTATLTVILVSIVALGSFALYLPLRTVIKTFGGPPSVESQENINRDTPGQEALRKKLDSIVLPTVDFKDVYLEEAVDFFRIRSVELDHSENDPKKKGVSIVIMPSDHESDSVKSPIPRMVLKNVSLGDALKLACEITQREMRVDDFAITLLPKE